MSRNIRKKDCPVPKPSKPVSKNAKGTCSKCHLQKREHVGFDDTHESCCKRSCPGWRTCLVTFHHPEVVDEYRAKMKAWERDVDKWVDDQRQRLSSERSKPTAKQVAAVKEKEKKQIDQAQTVLHAPELETALRQAFAGSEVKKVAQPVLLSALMQYTKGEDISAPSPKKRKIDVLNGTNMNSDAAILEELTKAKIDPQDYIRLIHRLVQQVFLKIIEDLSSSEDFDILSSEPPIFGQSEPKRQKRESQVRPIYFSGGQLIDYMPQPASANNNDLSESEIEEMEAMNARKRQSERETVRYLTSKVVQNAKPPNRGFPDPRAKAGGPVMRPNWTKEMEEAKTVSIHSDSDTDEYSVDEIWKENDLMARDSNCDV